MTHNYDEKSSVFFPKGKKGVTISGVTIMSGNINLFSNLFSKYLFFFFFWKKWLIRSRKLLSGERGRRTPGYHHLSAASNAVTRDYFSHNLTIWSKNIPYLIYKIWPKHRIKKWEPASCCWLNFWFFVKKKLFSDFDFLNTSMLSVKLIWT